MTAAAEPLALRAAGRDDLGGVLAVEERVFGPHVYPDFFFRQAWDLWPSLLRVAVGGGTVRGYALGARAAEPELAWVLSLALDASCRGRGVGDALLGELLQAMRQLGCRRARLTVAPGNPALRLYQRHGFVVQGEEAGYFGPGEDRLLLECPL